MGDGGEVEPSRRSPYESALTRFDVQFACTRATLAVMLPWTAAKWSTATVDHDGTEVFLVGDSVDHDGGRAVAVVSFLEDRPRPAELFTVSARVFSLYRKADPAVCGGRRGRVVLMRAFELNIANGAAFTVGAARQSHLPASPTTPAFT
jgi:hypothetical protein